MENVFCKQVHKKLGIQHNIQIRAVINWTVQCIWLPVWERSENLLIDFCFQPWPQILFSPFPFQKGVHSDFCSDYGFNSNHDDTTSTTATDSVANQSTTSSMINATTIRKGLLWQQRDKIFSRWKERFFILTQDYLQCFRKGTSRITEMGGFIFKLRLSEVQKINELGQMSIVLWNSFFKLNDQYGTWQSIEVLEALAVNCLLWHSSLLFFSGWRSGALGQEGLHDHLSHSHQRWKSITQEARRNQRLVSNDQGRDR